MHTFLYKQTLCTLKLAPNIHIIHRGALTSPDSTGKMFCDFCITLYKPISYHRSVFI